MNKAVIHLDRTTGQASFIGWAGEVNTFADLPPAIDHVGEFYMVLNATGSRFFLTYKASGLYRAEGSSWVKKNDVALYLNDDQFAVYNAADNTKMIAFNVSNIATGTKRVATWKDSDGEVAWTSDIITAHNNLTSIQGGAPGDYYHITLLQLTEFLSLQGQINGKVNSVVAGTNIVVDAADPNNPIVSLDLSDAEIKTKYESNADTNAFTDAEQTKLTGIEALAQVNTINAIIGGTNVTIDGTDPLNPIINASGGGGGVETIQINLGTIISSGAAPSGFIILGNELVYEVTGSNPNSFDKVAWLSFKVPTNYSSGGTFKIETWTDNNAVSLLANLYINDVVDATINSLDIEPSTTLTWENKSSAIGSVIVADDRISIRLVYTVPNNDNVRIRNMSFDYNT